MVLSIPSILRSWRLVATIDGALLLSVGLAAAQSEHPVRVAPAAPDLPPDWTREEVLAVLGQDWQVIRTPHVRVHVAPGLDVLERQLVDLESSLARMFAILSPEGSWREELARRPFEYFYTAREELSRRFVGFPTDGVAFPQHGITVAQQLPHEHELAHLAVHFAVQPSPPANEPLLQEGLASWLGGDSGRTPTVVLAEGDRVLDRSGIDPGALWTAGRFHAAPLSTESKYALAARWVDFLVDTGGIERVLALYRLLCGEGAELQRRPRSVLQTQVEASWDARWPILMERFHRWRADHPAGGIARVTDVGSLPSSDPDLRLAHEQVEARIWKERDGSLLIALQSSRRDIDVELIWGERVGGERVTAAPGGDRRRFGLRLDSQGARLRDYRDGRLLARAWWQLEDGHGRWVAVRLRPEVSSRVGVPTVAHLFVMPRFEAGVATGKDRSEND